MCIRDSFVTVQASSIHSRALPKLMVPTASVACYVETLCWHLLVVRLLATVVVLWWRTTDNVVLTATRRWRRTASRSVVVKRTCGDGERRGRSLVLAWFPPNKYIREPYGNNMGLNVVPIWVSPTGCLVRLLKGFCWDLYGSRDEAAQKGTT